MDPISKALVEIGRLKHRMLNTVARGTVTSLVTLDAPATVDVTVNSRLSDPYLVKGVVVMAPPPAGLVVGDPVVVFMPTGVPSEGAYCVTVVHNPNVLVSNLAEAVGTAALSVRQRPLMAAFSSWSVEVGISASVEITAIGVKIIPATSDTVPLLQIYTAPRRSGELLTNMDGQRLGEVENALEDEMIFVPRDVVKRSSAVYMSMSMPTDTLPGIGGRRVDLPTTASTVEDPPGGALTIGDTVDVLSIEGVWSSESLVPLLRVYGREA